MRSPILNLHSEKNPKPRFCDVIVEGDKVTFEMKRDKDIIETLDMEDLLYQVKVAKEMASKER